MPLPPGTDELAALLEVYAARWRVRSRTEHPDRMRLLLAAESAGMLVAAEMGRAGVPWRADVHRKLLDGLLGERYPGGLEPRRMAELADEVSRAFGAGARVRPDLPNDIIKAFARAGISLTSTRKWELQQIDHPAVAPLLEYKTLYRLHTAHGWAWLQQWVHDGRFRPEYLPGGTVSGRWTTNGGGALQIPKVIRQAVLADPGWRLVVADADQMEPRVLAAVSRDRGLMEVAGSGEDLYADLAARAFGGDRAQAKLAPAGRHLRPDLRRRPQAHGRSAPPLSGRGGVCGRRGARGRGGPAGAHLAGPHLPARVRGPPDEAGLPQEEEPSAAYGSSSARRPRPRPVHP